MKLNRVKLAIFLLAIGTPITRAEDQPPPRRLNVSVEHADGKYSIGMSNAKNVAVHAGIGVKVNGRWFFTRDYSRPNVTQSTTTGLLGTAQQWEVIYSGRSQMPELRYKLRAYEGRPYGDIQVTVRNTTGKQIHVEAIRSVDIQDGPMLDLGGPASANRVLSDSSSENRPDILIREFDAEPTHLGVGSQLIYNRQSHDSLFVGALTSDRFITLLRLRVAVGAGNIHSASAYEVESTGTTEVAKKYSLKDSGPEDQMELNVSVAPGEDLSSERVLFGLSGDYHDQLQTYGSLISEIHHARTSAPPLLGWWSWTAYYFGFNEGAALTNAEWESEHLKSLGYNVFHIDEGYQYARGEYETTNRTLFPHGMANLYHRINGMGLVPAIWTAPFEVSDRSWVYKNHPDWLVKNAQGDPIHIGYVVDRVEQLFALDTTNPGAQAYLRKTYSILANQWGIKAIKLDFMDDTAIEGFHYRPNTTAVEAQRIGLQIIRDAVGDNVYLDKDGSLMLNVVGYVDYGRTSEDTGHSFAASKRSASGIVARYYMNRNFFVTDPDAFTVSEQTVENYSHQKNEPATLDTAQVSIALAAVSGGMFEIGDDLPMLTRAPDRLSLVENTDLIDMIRLGRASVPIDLMTYAREDGQPSTFLLKEDNRQTILTVFNWSDEERVRTIDLTTLGLPPSRQYTITDVLSKKQVPISGEGSLAFSQPPHTVRVLKIIDTHISPAPPIVVANVSSAATTGSTLQFAANATGAEPVVSYAWNFGDGTTLNGAKVSHAYTQPGQYSVVVIANGFDGVSTRKELQVKVSGRMPSRFDPQHITRVPENP